MSHKLRLIYGVLKFAVTYKKPVVRSIFKYLDEPPSRLDLSKYKFGGPYTNEEAEDVKTFLWILCLIWPIMLIIIALGLIETSTDLEVLSQAFPDSKCRHTLIKSFAFNHYLLIVICILLYEFVIIIYPLIQWNLMRMLRCIIAAAFIFCLVTVFLVIADVIGDSVEYRSVCLLNATGAVPTIPIPQPGVLYPIEAVPNILTAITVVMLSTAAFEFAYAQSPYSMRGIIMGLVWFVFVVPFGIGAAIIDLWRHNWPRINDLCEVIFHSVSLLLHLLVCY